MHCIRACTGASCDVGTCCYQYCRDHSLDLALGNGLERSFSLLNDPAETHRYVIAVLREADSRGGSVWVHEHLRQGDRLVASEPINNFPLNEAGETHILIAGGIGITPLKAMAHRLA